jgi:hypothetical protein
MNPAPAPAAPDKPDDDVAAAWADLLAAPGPPDGTVFLPRRPPGWPVSECQVLTRALYEPDFRSTRLLIYRDDSTWLHHAIRLDAWSRLFYPDPAVPEPAADAFDRALDQLREFSPPPDAPVRHYKGGQYQILTPLLLRNDPHVTAAIAYRSEARGTRWVRTLDDFLQDVRLADGRVVPRFAPSPPTPHNPAQPLGFTDKRNSI